MPLTCTDPDGDALTLSIVDEPSKGTLGAISGDAVTYTPDAGEFGADSFTYRASDGTAESAPATVSITITRAPSCDAGDAQTTATEHGVGRRSTAPTPTATRWTLSIVDGPSKGSLGLDLRRRGHLHAGRGRVRRRLVHVRRDATAPPSRRRRRRRSRSRVRRAARTCRGTTAVGEPVSVPLTCTDPTGTR